MSQADDIRHFVRVNLIEPARARGDSSISIRAGDVHKEMELSNALPAVCSAIGSDKFLAEAAVLLAAREGPQNSTTTTFKFEFANGEALSVPLAEQELRRRYGTPDVDTKNLISFDLPDAREIALQRGNAIVQLWLEDNGPVPGAEQRPYEPNEGRHSNLPNRLTHQPTASFREQGFPRPVRSVRVTSRAQLKSILDWYEQRSSGDRAPEGGAVKLGDREVGVARQLPTNLILYGPPGTGKTYSSAREAVALCDGELPKISGRTALMERFNALKEAGRIAFVTFHQSYSYEEFVEGLRPETAGQDSEGQNSAGFRLKPTDGIFKRVAAVAQQAGRAGQTGIDLRTRDFFKMSLGSVDEDEDVYRSSIDENYIALGWGRDFDWTDPIYRDFDAILERWRTKDPNVTSLSSRVRQSHYMRAVVKEGDIVVVSFGNSQFRAIGEVIGPYEYVAGASQFRHRRKVRWLRVFERPLPVETILRGKFTQPALYKLDQAKLNLSALSTLIGEGKPGASGEAAVLPYVLIIDEINRANISKVFGELITLIEPDKRLGSVNALTVTLPYSGEDFGVPANLHLIGTMNTADRSIALLDTALRRRFQFKELMPDASLLGKVGLIDVSAVLERINERIEYLFDREHQIGHAYFMDCVTRDRLDEVMRNKIIPLLSEYFYEDWEKVRLVLGETDDEGRFIVRTKLLPPPTFADESALERFRYVVRESFAEAAYEGFML
ncbi:AAA family ATPase [Bradyrhizobium sacchari]|uniref:5-methylcytosine-specific restriction protein B n=1 Tax=Bradyrhizobium sacchari TaxID=1399419 RepID=A0A560HY75_9BRAD|nr:AAA family ATPase [Bradyrhizobium sacchari]TWB50891.1 5-methylcytosine-specific restriction protein B [Bradyrhizobium sacchari]TWB68901.1 5-methylcytosine-specific restriction protein B [Bradyrhizobium sacchari]